MSPKVKSPLEPSHLDPKEIKGLLSSSALDQLDNVFLCGVMGDPLASPYIKTFCETLQNLKPKSWTVIHTNGSLGSRSLWKWLGQFSKTYSLEVVFSIDGLKDTNEEYRIGVEWEKVLSNLKVFTEAGGQATWKFIIFPHNKHQVEEARQLASKLNCQKFYTRKNYDSERVPGKKTLSEVQLSKSFLNSSQGMSVGEMKEWVGNEHGKSKKIYCKAEKDQQLYIDSWGKVWPCCWIGNLGLQRPSFMDREVFNELVLKKYDDDFNCLKAKSFDEILQHPFFQKDLKASWENHNSGKDQCHSPACLKHCSLAI